MTDTPFSGEMSSITEGDARRLEAVVSRLADMEELMEMRFAEMRDRQSHLLGENAEQMVDLAERLDFAERVIAQQRPMNRLNPPNCSTTSTSAGGNRLALVSTSIWRRTAASTSGC